LGSIIVDYEPLTTPEESLARYGATYQGIINQFKNPHSYSIYSLNIGFLRSFSCITDIYLSPTVVDPPMKGFPNNPSHSLAEFTEISLEDEPMVFTKIQQHAIQRKVNPDIDKVRVLVREYRAQWG